MEKIGRIVAERHIRKLGALRDFIPPPTNYFNFNLNLERKLFYRNV